MRVQTILGVMTAMLVSLPAFAGKEKGKEKPVEQPTPFSKLSAEFEAAGPVKIDEIDGYYNGRCFESAHKSVVLPGLLGFAEFNAGPNFPDLKQRYVYRYSKYTSPDAFEHLDTDEEKKTLVKNVSTHPFTIGYSPAQEIATGITYTEFFSDSRTPVFKTEIRKKDGLFFVKTTAVSDGRIVLRSVNRYFDFDNGNVFELCYYYSPILSRTDVDKFR